MKWTASTLVAAGALLVAAPAMSAGVNLAWDNCRGGGGASNKLFACNTNAGSNTLVASVVAPSGIGSWNAFEVEIYWIFDSAQPAWWQLRNQTPQPGQCRNGALSVNALSAGLSGCTDPYNGLGVGGIGTYQNGPNIPAGEDFPPALNLARLLLVLAVPDGHEVPLTPDVEYFAAKVVITNAKTVGLDACAGCPLRSKILLTGVRISQPAGAPGGNPSVINPASFGSNYVWWQDGFTPTRSTTWGHVKALYR